MDIEYNVNVKNVNENVNKKRRGKKGAVIACALSSVILAAAVFGYVWKNASAEAEKNPVMLAQETVIPNISADMISAIDPAVIENYRVTHNVAARQSLYCYLPENGFKTPGYVNTDLTEDCVAPVTELSIDRKQNADLTALRNNKVGQALRSIPDSINIHVGNTCLHRPPETSGPECQHSLESSLYLRFIAGDTLKFFLCLAVNDI